MPVRPEALGTARYLAWLYSPPRLREPLGLLLELEAQICAPRAAPLDHQVAHARLAWWREECERLARGTPAHPLTRALLALRTPAAPARLDCSGLIEAATWDLAQATFDTREELAGYCGRWASALTQLAAQLAAPSAVSAERAGEIGRSLGAHVREIELLAALAPEAHAGRLRLSLDELERAAVDADSIARPPWSEALAMLVRARLTTLRAGLTRTLGLLERAERQAWRGLVVWAVLAERQARCALTALPDGWRPSRLDRIAEGWGAWRAARGIEHGAVVSQTQESTR
jgi:phytoene synthase